MKMDLVTRVQILVEAACLSQNDDAPGKDMNPTILPPAMDG